MTDECAVYYENGNLVLDFLSKRPTLKNTKYNIDKHGIILVQGDEISYEWVMDINPSSNLSQLGIIWNMNYINLDNIDQEKYDISNLEVREAEVKEGLFFKTKRKMKYVKTKDLPLKKTKPVEYQSNNYTIKKEA